MALLSLLDVSKAYDAERPLLTGITFVVREDDRVGLIGPNGAGKSTLLKLCAGLEAPDAGERVARRGLRIGLLEQEPRFAPDATVRAIVGAGLEERAELVHALEETHAALAAPKLAEPDLARLLRRTERLQHRLDLQGGHDVAHLVEATIDGVGLVDPDARCGTLSGGEARRVALARLLVSEPDVLLLDEPTNHLDAFVVGWLEERLARLAVPLVLVTHDRYLLDRTVDRIVEVDRGVLHEYAGGYARYVEARAARLEAEGRAERGRLATLRRETEWMRRGAPARTTKQKARIERYEELVADAPERLAADLELRLPPGPRLGTKVVRLEGVAHRYGERTVLPRLDLEITADMRLGVVGPNGAGKSTLLAILLGRLAPSAGRRIVGETVRFATVDQARSDLDPDKTIVEEVAGAADHVAVGERSVHVAGFLDGFLFPGAKKHVLVGSLSGGERGRVLLAKLLLAGGNVLVLDEPTNDLDLATLRALEEALTAFPGAVVVVSHDRWFLDRVATHVLHLDGQGGARLFPGDVSALFAELAAGGGGRRAERREAESGKVRGRSSERPGARGTDTETESSASPSSAPSTGGPSGDASSKASKRLSNWERRELEEVTERVATLESALAELDARLADPALWRGDAADARKVQSEREAASTALDSAMERWTELAERDA